MVKVTAKSEEPVARRLIAWLTIGPVLLCSAVVGQKIPDNLLQIFVGAMVLVGAASFVLLERLLNRRVNRVEEVRPRIAGGKSRKPADPAWLDRRRHGRSAEDLAELEYGPSRRWLLSLKVGTLASLVANLAVVVLIGKAWLATPGGGHFPPRFVALFVPALLAMLVMISLTLAAWASLVRFQVGQKAVRVTYPFRPFGRDFSFAYSEIQQIDVLAIRDGQRVCISLSGGRNVHYADEDKWTVHDFVTELRSGIERSGAVSHPLSDEAVFGEPGP